MTRPQKRTMSPKVASQSRGTASQSMVSSAGRPAPRSETTVRPRASLDRSLRSLDVENLRMGGEECLCEDVVEREDAQRGDDDRLVDGAADARGAAAGGHALVTADDGDDRPEQRALQDRAPQIRDRRVGQQVGEERAGRLVVDGV